MKKAILVVLNLAFVLLSVPILGQEVEKFEFQAEVSRMMDIIINSLYQKKEVFLREVLSNSADALDKIRFLALQDPDELNAQENLEIRISFDEAAKTLTFRDSGVGMTRQELIENLGTVAKSGTTNFIEQLANSGDLSLIGQFGVGFYSVYLVADKVQVRTKSNSDEQYIWESTADSTFTIRTDVDGERLSRGTEITLFLKEDALEYANSFRLTSLIERYSEFIAFPIYLYKEVKQEDMEEDEDDIDEDEEEDYLDEDDDLDEDGEEDEEEDETEWQWVLVNSQKAIWTRSPSEIDIEEYKSFYRSMTKTSGDPLAWTHFKAEGEVEFKSILFIPSKAPYNQYDQYYNIDSMLKLYVRKVLIRDDFDDLLPKYLNFIKGVVDSDDLPLSVSRETLQQAKAVNVIGKKLVRKAIDLLLNLANKEIPIDEDDEDFMEEVDTENGMGQYQEFYSNFGKNIKLGVVEDSNNRERLTKLLRYKTTKTEDGSVEAPGGFSSLEAYVNRMKSWQKSIFYITGENVAALKKSPLLKKALSKGIEVILMDDPVDEYVLQNLKKFDGYELQSLAKDGVKFGDESVLEKKIEEEYKQQYQKLTKWLKNEVYNNGDEDGKAEMINKILVTSTRIDENIPAVVIAARYGNSATMERLMMSQALGDTAKKTIAQATKVMEINPRSPIIHELRNIFETDPDQAKDIAWLLLDTALVSSGFDINEKTEFSNRMFRLMKAGLHLQSLEPLPLIEVPEDEEDDGKEDL